MSSNKKLSAFYLPQYHPTPRNDKWWGKGFTEWTNVAKAKPLYHGHHQPNIPADLGFYDLRLPETRQAQADLARGYGVYGFCYYHYWFEYGFEELETPFYEVVNSGEPNFPFCLCWANETWYSKFWNIDGTIEKKPLAEQKYLGKEDNEKHFYKLLKAFKDPRYIKCDGKLLFVIYKALEFQGLQEFMAQWNELAANNGLPGFYFVAYTCDCSNEFQRLKSLGVEKIITCHMLDLRFQKSRWDRIYDRFIRKWLKMPVLVDYGKYYKYLVSEYEKDADAIPTILPNWDHSPRSGKGALIFTNTTPENFDKHVKQVTDIIDKKEGEQLCFLKSWNEWGEGNYVEPDLRYGHGFLEVIKKYFKN